MPRAPGTETISKFRDVVDLLKASDVTTYVIGYLEHQPQSAKTEQRMQLQRMAELTGGDAFFPSSVKELERSTRKIERTIAARYSARLYVDRHPDERRLAQGADPSEAADLKGAKLHTREGYYAPYKESSSR